VADEKLATYVVLPKEKTAVEASVKEVEALLSVLGTWSIKTEADEVQAAGLMKEAHARGLTLERQRKHAVAPAVIAQKTINDLFRPAIKGWAEAKTITKRLLTEAVAKREEANRACLAAAASGDTAALQELQTATPAAAGIAYRDDIHIEITDVNAVPREYMCVDWSRLKILAKKGGTAPEGVRFVRKTKVQVGR